MTAQDVRPAPHPVDRLWQLATADRALALLALLLVLTTLAGALLPQLPIEAVQEDRAGRWLAETSSRYGSLGEFLRQAGLFDLWRSPWLRGLLGALAFALLLRLAQSAARALDWRSQRGVQRAAAAAKGWPLQASLALDSALDAALDELTQDLEQEGWRVGSDVAGAQAHVLAERSLWGAAAPLLLYAGLVVALAGLWLGQVFGWQAVGLTLTPGEAAPIGHEDRRTLTLLTGPQGNDAVALQSAAGLAIMRTFSAAGVARIGGLTVQRTGQGLALSISAADREGAPLPLQPLEEPAAPRSSLNLVFAQPRAERAFLVPQRQLAFSVVAFSDLPERGFTGPTFLVQAFQVGRREPILNQFAEGDAALAVGSDVYTLRSGRYITVQVSRNPGLPLTLLGGLLAAIGLLLGFWRPAGRLHLHLQDQRGAVSVLASLWPSPAWRQGSRWLAVWAATYAQQETQP